MKVVVTGAAGFLGSHLTKECVSRGFEVLGIDNLISGRPEHIKKDRFFGLPGIFKFEHCDICSIDLHKHFSKADVVFHLAALPRVQYSVDYPMEANRANVTGTINVLEAARLEKVRRVVFASSSVVYGEAKNIPTMESEKPMPKSPYAVAKLAGEHYCRVYSEIHGLDTVSLRYFNLYGENQLSDGAYSTVISAFLDQKFNLGLCQINGDGKVARDFCYVGDAVNASILAAQSKKLFKGDVINVGSGEMYSVNDVYDKICEISNKIMPKRYSVARQGEPQKMLAEISRAEKILGYKPTVSFSEGVERVYKWWKDGCKVI